MSSQSVPLLAILDSSLNLICLSLKKMTKCMLRTTILLLGCCCDYKWSRWYPDWSWWLESFHSLPQVWSRYSIRYAKQIMCNSNHCCLGLDYLDDEFDGCIGYENDKFWKQSWFESTLYPNLVIFVSDISVKFVIFFLFLQPQLLQIHLSPANLTTAIHFTLAFYKQISTNFHAFKIHWNVSLQTLKKYQLLRFSYLTFISAPVHVWRIFFRRATCDRLRLIVILKYDYENSYWAFNNNSDPSRSSTRMNRVKGSLGEHMMSRK